MSFILDALRKAERDRHLGQPPSLIEMGRAPALLTPTPPSRRSWMLLALIIVMAALLIALVRAPITTPEQATALPAPAVPAVAPLSTTTRVPAFAAPLRVDAPQRSSTEPPALDVDADLFSLDDLTGEAAPVPVYALGEQFGAQASSAMSDPLDDGQRTPAPIPLDGDAEGTDTVSERGDAPVTDGTNLQALAQSEDIETVAVPEEKGPRLLRNMPVEFRSSFPAVQIDVHVFDPEPQRRWILVQGRRYAEGDTLPQGTRVEEITAQGTVMGWLDQDILMPLTQ